MANAARRRLGATERGSHAVRSRQSGGIVGRTLGLSSAEGRPWRPQYLLDDADGVFEVRFEGGGGGQDGEGEASVLLGLDESVKVGGRPGEEFAGLEGLSHLEAHVGGFGSLVEEGATAEQGAGRDFVREAVGARDADEAVGEEGHRVAEGAIKDEVARS